MSNRQRIVQLALLLLVATVASGQDFDLSWYTMDAGGEMFSSGDDFLLKGTIGQPDVGAMEGGEFFLTGGFWFEEPPGDCNSTGNVDLLDYDDFNECLSGPGGGLPLPECNCFDIDCDGDIDLSDIGRFQREFTNG